VGGDRVSGWPNASTSGWFAGSIDELAIYPYPMTADQAARHAMAWIPGLPPIDPGPIDPGPIDPDPVDPDPVDPDPVDPDQVDPDPVDPGPVTGYTATETFGSTANGTMGANWDVSTNMADKFSAAGG